MMQMIDVQRLFFWRDRPARPRMWTDTDSGDLCRLATRRECGLMLFFSFVGAVLLVALIIGCCWLATGAMQ
jgi:hypothetical protein